MPRDFKSFAKEKEKTNIDAEDILNKNKDKANMYQDILNKYKNMNNNDLMKNLLTEATKLKQQGKLDNNTLNSLKTTLLPFLNEEQKSMLNNLINAINEQE